MSEFRIGDRRVVIAGVPTHLRLSLSALAEMASGLEAGSPAELAARLRRAAAADWTLILQAMATPRPTEDLSKTELLALVPTLSAVMSEGLTS